jgi:hypothetical protein
VEPSSRIEAEEVAKGFGFSTEFGAKFHVNLVGHPPLPPIMNALAEAVRTWLAKRGLRGVRIQLLVRGIDENLDEVQTELKAMIERTPEIKQRLGTLKEWSASFLDKGLKQIGSFKLSE